jgi:DNA-binding response OmpR family regulator
MREFRPSILIVDDDAQIRTLCKHVLAENEYLVMEASNGKEALALFGTAVFNLVVLDLSMPDMDGLELLQAVRLEWPRPRTIVMSGFMHGTMLRVAALSGADATLAKPFSTKALLSVISEVLAAIPSD